MSDQDYRLWKTADGTLLVRIWPDDQAEVMTRPDRSAAWGPPKTLEEEGKR